LEKAASNRLAGWRNPTSITVTPSTPDPVEVTEISLGPDDDTIWIHVTTNGSADCPWPWAFAILTWVNSQGRELGSCKIHGPCEGEVFRLGNGRKPVERTGSIRIYPRSYNLRWVDLGHPWNLDFKFETGTLAPPVVVDLGGSTLGSFVPDDGGAPLDYELEAELFLNLLLYFLK